MTGVGESDVGSLELTEVQGRAVWLFEGLVRAAIDVGGTDFIEPSGGLAAMMLSASGAVLSAGLPDCPYPDKPPGTPVSPRWSKEATPRLILQCSHQNPHCWDGVGNPIKPCP